MSPWEQLAAGLDALSEAVATSSRHRVGATLALLREVDDDLEIVYTRRQPHLSAHAGQVSLPGGRVDAGESVEQAALREAAEEIALDPASVAVLGRLPGFYVPPSGFWLQTVLARWDRPHPLRAADAEVAAILPVRLSLLRSPETWRAVRVSTGMLTWAWQLDERHLLWGATAGVTALLLGLLSPDWHAGRTLADLGAHGLVTPPRD